MTPTDATDVDLPPLPPAGISLKDAAKVSYTLMQVLADGQPVAVYSAEALQIYARQAVMRERAKWAGCLEALQQIAAQGSALPGSTSRVDCMAALAAAAIRGEKND